MFAYVVATVRRFIQSDEAQDAFEYLLVIGGISVAVVIAIATIGFDEMAGAVIDGVCNAIDTIGVSWDMGDCTAAAAPTT